MKLDGLKVIFDQDEIEEYGPLWRTISSARTLREKRRLLAPKVVGIDDVAVVEGTHPLLAELNPFGERLKAKARELSPDIADLQLTRFVFFVLNIDEELAEKLEVPD